MRLSGILPWQWVTAVLNGCEPMFPVFDHPIWLVPAFAMGACIGSFLNVVIYRVPLGMSVNHPRRSFCPSCRAAIPPWLNLPMVSWLWLRGKCRSCGVRIPFRYFGVELVTALLFVAAWLALPPLAAVFLWVMIALLVAVTFIDAEHLIIPTGLTWAGAVAGLAACAAWPRFPVMGGVAGGWLDGLKQGGIGWAAGFLGLWGVVELGKLAFGRKAMRFEQPVAWHLKEPEGDQDPLCFVIDGDEIPWWDLFSRKTDRLIIDAKEIRVDGEDAGSGVLVIRELEIELPDGVRKPISGLASLSGKAASVVIPREAMGFGDVHLLGMIGAFFGWTGVFFSLFAASIYAILWAIVGRIGFGRQLPFGPFLAVGALSWVFGGWRLWAWYMDFLGPLWSQG
jgi:leader peptidase (prepilin peptidase) / N-methyltransferase